MKKQDLTYKHLLYYIATLEPFRRPTFDTKLRITELLFNTQQYDLAISDIKRYLEISKSIKISVKKKLSMKETTEIGETRGAYIQIPHNLFKRPEAINHNYNIFINPVVFKNFDLFVMVIVHELCHLKLFIEETSCKIPKRGEVYFYNDEKAVDTLAILSGFGNSYARIAPSLGFSNPDYITRSEFYFLYECFSKNRRFVIKTKLPWYKKIWKRL